MSLKTRWWVAPVLLGLTVWTRSVAAAAEMPAVRTLAVETGDFFDITSVDFSADGRLVASSWVRFEGWENPTITSEIKVWNTATGQLVRLWKVADQAVQAVAFAPNGKTLATGIRVVRGERRDSGEVRLWDIPGGRLLQTLPTGGHVHKVVFSPDGKLLASNSLLIQRLGGNSSTEGGSEIKVWD
ncbi:MAG: hypothetical protein M3347_17165, partial [Armatimonadota bacterium]|nr:hypothetical protein [Armatimonadota bacterium]